MRNIVLILILICLSGCQKNEISYENCYEESKYMEPESFDVIVTMISDYQNESTLLELSENIIVENVIRSGQRDLQRIEDRSSQGITTFEITEVLKGELSDETIDISESFFGLHGTVNDTFLELEEGKKYILFVDMYKKIPDDPILFWRCIYNKWWNDGNGRIDSMRKRHRTIWVSTKLSPTKRQVS